MGNELSTSIEISAPPDVVRAVFLDFPRYKEWASEWSLTNKKDVTAGAEKMESGDKIGAVLPLGSFTTTVQDNKPELFAWLGSVPVIYTGRHEFRFEPSESTPGGTKFTQIEMFTGAASFLMGEGWSMRTKTAAAWTQFDQDLKAEAEKRAGA